jgi:hypothetical protein
MENYFCLRGITGSSHGNYLFACLFIVVSALFTIDLFRNKMQFFLPNAGWRRHATLALLALVFCYPLVGIVKGHRPPKYGIYEDATMFATGVYALVLLIRFWKTDRTRS